jgi:hypothetical protein
MADEPNTKEDASSSDGPDYYIEFWKATRGVLDRMEMEFDKAPLILHPAAITGYLGRMTWPKGELAALLQRWDQPANIRLGRTPITVPPSGLANCVNRGLKTCPRAYMLLTNDQNG